MTSPSFSYGTQNAKPPGRFTLFTRFTAVRKRTTDLVPSKTSRKGLRRGWTRATFILRDDYLKKIKSIAYWERKRVKEVVDELLGIHLKGKKIRPEG